MQRFPKKKAALTAVFFFASKTIACPPSGESIMRIAEELLDVTGYFCQSGTNHKRKGCSMRTGNCFTSALMIAFAATLSSHALSEPLESIESIGFEYANYRNHTSIGGTIAADIPVYRADHRTFFTASLGGGTIRQNRGSSYDRVGMELGLKYHVTPVTSAMVAGSYDWFLGSPNYKIAAAHVRLRQALLPADAPVLPFVRVNGTLQFLDPVAESPARQDRNYRLIVVEALGGVEVRIRNDFRWVLEGGRSQSKAINNAGPDLADGWILRIAMRYDWF